MAMLLRSDGLLTRCFEHYPGIAVTALAFAVAGQSAGALGGPVLVHAMVVGFGLHFMSQHSICRPGLDFCAKPLLRLGVALLGARVSVADMQTLGAAPLAIAVGAVLTTMVVSVPIARLLGMRRDDGLLTGGSVAICGASAALALSSVMQQTREQQRLAVATVAGVSILSTIAMVAYPHLAGWAGLTGPQTGAFLGASIHDVAQVVGAGFSVSPEVGKSAVIVKLVRVSCLLPAVFCVALLCKSAGASGNPSPFPMFMVAFVALAIANSAGLLPRPVADAAASVSALCFGLAVAALGMKTSIRELRSVGWKPALLQVLCTVWIAGFVMACLVWGF